MKKKFDLSRRTILKGAGVALALPLLEIMQTATAFAQATNVAKHFMFLYFPNGTYGRGYDGTYNMVDPFDPIGTGTNYQLPEILSSLQTYRSNLVLFRGLQNNVTLNSPGIVNPHARGSAGLLTAHSVDPSPANGIKNGISVDQILANQVGAGTKFPSIVITNPFQPSSGAADSVFWNNISWSSTSKPSLNYTDPRALFDKLFAGAAAPPAADVEAQKRLFYKQSILDSTKDSIARLKAMVGQSDKHKLDEHFTSIRAIEVALEKEATSLPPAVACNSGTRPAAFSANDQLTQWIDTMVDLVTLAIRCDLTRVVTMNMDQEGSNRNMAFMGAVGQGHDISHHIENNKTPELIKVNRYFVERFKRALDVQRGSGTSENLLNTGLTMFGTPFSNGNYHNASNVPIILAGNANGNLQTGRGYVYDQRMPLANLHLRILRMYGINQASFGNSQGVLNI